ncbi:hypothetical protein [Gynuella sunshinyii]|uniref:Uncharacterized protein n=1 Tax=Gynuella sunshinyii YC6258 TaxID=1445510 RepID=A0A0C5VTX2_9GAMM|nr:hypothetical protein [Gynuella sunshinyii]AJQ93784.1 hypothetical Protein YC6258_01740 [Gynuella sunshinyii YC6258]
MRNLFCALCLTLLSIAGYAHNESPVPYRLVDATIQYQAPALITFESRWQDGDNPLNQFRIKRITHLNYDTHPLKPLLLTASFNATLEHYALSSTGRYQDSFEATLALAGFDVWIVEDRIFTSDPSDCDWLDCSIMGTWGLELRGRDIEFTRQLIQHATHVANPVIGGVTGGGMAAIAAVNANNTHYRALFSTAGLYSTDEAIRQHNQAACDSFYDQIDAGNLYRDSLGGLDVLIAAARDFPDSTSAADPSVSNYQFVVNVLTSPGGLGFLAFTPTYRFAAPTATLDDYQYMKADMFFKDSEYFGTLVSNNHFANLNCSIAGDRTFTHDLNKFTGDVLFLGGGESQAPLEIDTASLFEQANVQVIVDPADGGEADNYLVDYSLRQEVLDQPLINWLQQQYD